MATFYLPLQIADSMFSLVCYYLFWPTFSGSRFRNQDLCEYPNQALYCWALRNGPLSFKLGLLRWIGLCIELSTMDISKDKKNEKVCLTVLTRPLGMKRFA